MNDIVTDMILEVLYILLRHYLTYFKPWASFMLYRKTSQNNEKIFQPRITTEYVAVGIPPFSLAELLTKVFRPVKETLEDATLIAPPAKYQEDDRTGA